MWREHGHHGKQPSNPSSRNPAAATGLLDPYTNKGVITLNSQSVSIAFSPSFFSLHVCPSPRPARPEAEQEVTATLSDLASVLAKSDEAETPEPYADLLNQFGACLQEGDDGGLAGKDQDFTSGEILAATMWASGIYSMISEFQSAFSSDSTDSNDEETTNYTYLEGALAICQAGLGEE